MIQTVLFDRDETLGYSDATVYQEAARMVLEHHPELSARQVLKAMQEQWAASDLAWPNLRTHEDEEAFWQQYCEELAVRMGVPLDTAYQVRKHFPYWAFLRSYEDTEQVLQILKQNGYTTAILSNTLPSMEPTLVALGIEGLIDQAFASCSLGVHKPEVEVFSKVAALLGQRPEQILFVDDKLENVEAARQAGMEALWIDRANRDPDAIHDLHGVLDHLGLTVQD
ncbi:HAD family hydrolase [Deinococcus cellulosilyticus]|uniref:Hydrolase n=1 Tax=Deinococcus cellulosilyticus (strain DSM 18568 / NBRC 106333 / KACC 11606 / 5516J-15) TaxID=1223518 RepID=A0A511MZR2_DEIC1|nr:HAD-IA family hydrolase [Deinococcus cellulosilyticus]GEM46084.1 hydrolase [Deinococcus cellulosilyticus NBRC 106333 = KACC 11606]